MLFKNLRYATIGMTPYWDQLLVSVFPGLARSLTYYTNFKSTALF